MSLCSRHQNKFQKYKDMITVFHKQYSGKTKYFGYLSIENINLRQSDDQLACQIVVPAQWTAHCNY